MHAICLFVCLSFWVCAASDRFTFTKKDTSGAHNSLEEATNLTSLIRASSCSVCYGDTQCWNAGDVLLARCEYLAETAKILPQDEVDEDEGQSTGVRIEVNDALGDLMFKAAEDERYHECIPHVSEYTNCHEGNICLGCKRCRCSRGGTWSCHQVQKCVPNRVHLEIDHEILNLAIEQLNSMYPNSLDDRKKRSFQSSFRKSTEKLMNSDKPKPSRLSVHMEGQANTVLSPTTSFRRQEKLKHYDLSQKYGLDPLTGNLPRTSSFLDKESRLQIMTDDLFEEIKKNLSVSNYVFKAAKNKSELDFKEDLLNNDSKHSHKDKYNKLLDKTINSTVSLKKKYDVGDLLNMVNVIYKIKGIEDSKSTTKYHQQEIKTSEIAQKLDKVKTMPLKYKIKKPSIQTHVNTHEKTTDNHETIMNMQSTVSDYMDMNLYSNLSEKISLYNNDLNEMGKTDYIDFDDINSVNVMKRDVSYINQFANIANNSQTLQDLSENVLQPLNNIINEKQNEITGLKKVKEKLLDYLRNYINENYTLNTNKTQLIEESKQFAIYQLAINPQSTQENAELSNLNLRKNELYGTNETKAIQTQANKYLRKLKRDIYEVLKDVIAVKKVTGKEEPHELNILTRALKFYIRSQTKPNNKFSQNNEMLNWWNIEEKTRKLYSEKRHHSSIKDELLHIFTTLENDIPRENDSSTSPHSRKVIIRILRGLVGEDTAESDDWLGGEELVSLGEKINTSLADIRNASVFDIIDKMKILNLVLRANEDKMRNAYLALNKYKNRRTQNLIDDYLEDALETIKKNVDTTKKYISRMFVDIDTSNYLKGFGKSHSKVNQRQTKKESFMRYLKKILGKSKKGILRIVHRTPPPKNKNLELLTMNRLIDYERIMKKWQNDLDVTSKRTKRSGRRQLNDWRLELNKILPKYLRGEVGPGIIAKTKANRINQRRYFVDRDENISSYRRRNNKIAKVFNKLSETSNNAVDVSNNNDIPK